MKFLYQILKMTVYFLKKKSFVIIIIEIDSLTVLFLLTFFMFDGVNLLSFFIK